MNERTGFNSQIKFEKGDTLDIPFEDDSFDVVFSQHVMMNIENKTGLAQEVRRVLRPGDQGKNDRRLDGGTQNSRSFFYTHLGLNLRPRLFGCMP